ncbi:hypothetical protein Hypma_003344 [Hypsizygus marmoreus]|uniref:Uncharacterized protein n=1 Tax=Hypsizygus marmoreus TaxID=39966 RepID=A0A369J9M5_HYPMA|nr:hypothetical protein Hypma_003344 [Hypsizygus marmoreus]
MSIPVTALTPRKPKLSRRANIPLAFPASGHSPDAPVGGGILASDNTDRKSTDAEMERSTSASGSSSSDEEEQFFTDEMDLDTDRSDESESDDEEQYDQLCDDDDDDDEEPISPFSSDDSQQTPRPRLHQSHLYGKQTGHHTPSLASDSAATSTCSFYSPDPDPRLQPRRTFFPFPIDIPDKLLSQACASPRLDEEMDIDENNGEDPLGADDSQNQSHSSRGSLSESFLGDSSHAPVNAADTKKAPRQLHSKTAAQNPPPPPPTSRSPPVSNHVGKKHRPGAVLDLHADIRVLVFRAMGRVAGEPIMPSNIASTEAVRLFAATKREDHGPSCPGLKVDISTPDIASGWNKRASILFGDYFRLQPGYESADEIVVRSHFMTHLQTLRKQWVKSRLELDSTGQQALSDQNVMKARGTHRRNLLDRRQKVCVALMADPSIQRLIPLISSLKSEVMSGDESDHRNGERKYVIRRLAWRNPELDHFFMILDALHLSMRFGSDGRAKRGKFPHPRIRDVPRPAAEVDAVPALPINFYNPKWLDTLDPLSKRLLDAQDPVSLDFSPYIMRRAKKFEHVINSSTAPLPDNHPSLPPKVPAPVVP